MVHRRKWSGPRKKKAVLLELFDTVRFNRKIVPASEGCLLRGRETVVSHCVKHFVLGIQ